GAALSYNLLLVELRLAHRVSTEDEELHTMYTASLEKWWEEVSRFEAMLRRWDIAGLWAMAQRGNPNIHPRTRRFVETWLSVVFHHLHARSGAEDVVRSERVVELLKSRERELKGS